MCADNVLIYANVVLIRADNVLICAGMGCL